MVDLPVKLFRKGNFKQKTFTDSNGYFRFNDLKGSSYYTLKIKSRYRTTNTKAAISGCLTSNGSPLFVKKIIYKKGTKKYRLNTNAEGCFEINNVKNKFKLIMKGSRVD